ncbi:unnamed protein product, partial [Mesorhabditis spiculigera]
MAPTPRRHQEESFFGVVTEIIFGLVDSTGGPIVVLLFLVAISIIVYAALSLYRMCKEEFRDRETEIDSFEVRRPLPRRVYEIQAEEGVLDGVFLSPDELSDGHSKPTSQFLNILQIMTRG